MEQDYPVDDTVVIDDTVVLISCVKQKVDTPDGPITAKDLYTSELFKKSLVYAKVVLEISEERIFILSDEYHLLPLNQPVSNYEKNLNDASEDEKKIWADVVWGQLSQKFGPDTHYIILAGENYYKYLISADRIKNVELPLKGMRMGERLSALKSAITNNQAITQKK